MIYVWEADKMKRGHLLAVLLCAGCMLTGCSSFSPDVSGISIDKKGEITEVVREMFDESVYSKEELESQLGTEVAEYNAQAGAEVVKEKKLQIKDGVAVLKMTYASSKDYAAFNNLDFFSGDIIGAVQAGYMFEGSFYKVEKGTVDQSSSVWGSGIISGTNDRVAVFEGPLLVEVPGEIVYVSSNIQVTDKSTAVGSQSARGYVVYKE